jgi:CheY-like chemotaxis protein
VAGPEAVDIVIVGALPGATQSLLARGVPTHPTACTVYVALEPTPAPSYSIAPDRLLPDLLPLLNRVAGQRLAAQAGACAASDQASLAATGAAPQPARVLLVKADDDARVQLWAQLEALGCRVSAVDTAAAAQERLAPEAWDLVLVDRWLADADGTDFATALRHTPRLAKRPIWVLSAQVRWREVIRCAWRGLDGYLAIPAAPVELRRLLERSLDLRWAGSGAAPLVRAAGCR